MSGLVNRARRAWWHVLYWLGYERRAWPRLWGERPRVGQSYSYVVMDEVIEWLEPPSPGSFLELMGRLHSITTAKVEWLADTFLPSFRPSDLWGDWSWEEPGRHTTLDTSYTLSYNA